MLIKRNKNAYALLLHDMTTIYEEFAELQFNENHNEPYCVEYMMIKTSCCASK